MSFLNGVLHRFSISVSIVLIQCQTIDTVTGLDDLQCQTSNAHRVIRQCCSSGSYQRWVGESSNDGHQSRVVCPPDFPPQTDLFEGDY